VIDGAPHPDAESVAGIVLPAGTADLLLPNAAVAEVVAYRSPAGIEGAPPWLLGHLDWRDRPVPVVSIAAADGGTESAAPGRRARLAVCYTPSGNAALPYVAFLAVEPARLARFRAEGLKPAKAVPENPFVLHALTHAERPAWIPDLDAIEQAVLEALKP
jgi:chemosensory pili system protein ChpC